jgi:sec-independent protein translocase protein TatB
MFNIGGGEMIAIFLLALLVLGPERLPKAMGQVGRAVAQMRKLSSGFQDEIRRAMDPIEAPFRPGQETLKPAITDEVRVVATAEPEAEPEPEPVDLAKADADPEPEAVELAKPDDSAELAAPPELDEPADPDAPVGIEPSTETLVVVADPEPPPRRTGGVTPLRPRIEDVDEATG